MRIKHSKRIKNKRIRKDLGNPSYLKHNAFIEKLRLAEILRGIVKSGLQNELI